MVCNGDRLKIAARLNMWFRLKGQRGWCTNSREFLNHIYWANEISIARYVY